MPHHTFIVADVMEGLRSLPDESVHCVVTSPPYFGLRDYGVEPTVWGGDTSCDHRWQYAASSAGWKRGNREGDLSTSSLSNPGRQDSVPRAATAGIFCDCGAWLGCLGLEPTPEMYIDHMVKVMREVRRVLRPDGVLWCNISDSYNGSGGAGGDYAKGGIREGQPKYPGRRVGGLKPKDLMGVPWMLAFALRGDGWWLRSDVIWSKKVPMPESVTDRPTRSHEYVFLFSRSARYLYDAAAVAELGSVPETDQLAAGEATNERAKRGPGNWNVKPVGLPGEYEGRGVATKIDGGRPRRNRRDVWELGPEPFGEAHFATMPPTLAELCILAGCPEGGTVLDPFGGSGTVSLVAKRLGRSSVYIDLNPAYAQMAVRRCDFAQTTLHIQHTHEIRDMRQEEAGA